MPIDSTGDVEKVETNKTEAETASLADTTSEARDSLESHTQSEGLSDKDSEMLAVQFDDTDSWENNTEGTYLQQTATDMADVLLGIKDARYF